MAFSFTSIGLLSSGTNASLYTSSAPLTPNASRLVIAVIEAAKATATTDPAVAGYGLTWSKINAYTWNTGATQGWFGIWAAFSGASPSGTAVTANFGAQAMLGCEILVTEVGGADVSGTVAAAFVQTVLGTVDAVATSGSITLAALGSPDNAAFGTFGHVAAEVTTAGSGFTTIHDVTHAGPNQGTMDEWKLNTTTVNASWTTSAKWGGIAAEIKAVSTAGGLLLQPNIPLIPQGRSF